jgi:hypothetical protein
MLKAKDGEFFISDWFRNRNTVEFLGIWESVFNPDFNYGEFATIRSQAGLNSYKINYRIHTDAIKDTLIPPSITKAQATAVMECGRLARNISLLLSVSDFQLSAFTHRPRRPHQPRKPQLRPHPPGTATARTPRHPQRHRHHPNADPPLRQQREAPQIELSPPLPIQNQQSTIVIRQSLPLPTDHCSLLTRHSILPLHPRQHRRSSPFQLLPSLRSGHANLSFANFPSSLTLSPHSAFQLFSIYLNVRREVQLPANRAFIG